MRKRKYHEGQIWKTSKGGDLEIIQYVDYYNVLVEFKDKYKVQKWTDCGSIRRGDVKNPYVPSVYGFGINDSKTEVQKFQTVGDKKVMIWACPFYKAWGHMLERCYTDRVQSLHPTYQGCSVCEDWRFFSNFRAWMQTQDWEGKQLDKDLLVENNKIYSPDTCVFVSPSINAYLPTNSRERDLPLGVQKEGRGNMFRARGGFGHENVAYLGLYTTPEEAHEVWQNAKLRRAKELQSIEKDVRVIKGLQRIIDKLNYHIEQKIITTEL